MSEYDPLAIYYEAEWRNFTQDIPFLIQESQNYGGPILELACGSGRVTFPLAREGFEIWDIDNSPEMLKIFDRKLKDEDPDVRERVHFSQQDMRTFQLDRKFKVIIIPFNSFLLLTDRADIDKCLQTCLEHLEDDGQFIIDVFSPNFDLCAVREPKMQFLQHFYIPEIQKVVVQWELAKRDMANQLIDIDFLYEEYDQKGKITQRVII